MVRFVNIEPPPDTFNLRYYVGATLFRCTVSRTYIYIEQSAAYVFLISKPVIRVVVVFYSVFYYYAFPVVSYGFLGNSTTSKDVDPPISRLHGNYRGRLNYVVIRARAIRPMREIPATTFRPTS